MNKRPSGQPIGILLSTTAREVDRAFDTALASVGGTRSTWLILMTLKQGPLANQREMAARIGIESSTLTHHLNAMENDGLVTRRRDPANRRLHLVQLTPAGEQAFERMLGTVIAFDRRLNAGFDAEQIALVRDLLQRLRTNLMIDLETDRPALETTIPLTDAN